MDPKIQNLTPQQQADAANKWNNFVKALQDRYPEIRSIETPEEFYAWRAAHPEIDISTEAFEGKAYATKNPEIGKANTAFEINKTLKTGQKDIRYVEKKKNEDEEKKISPNDARRIIEQINKAREQQLLEQKGLISSQQQPPPSQNTFQASQSEQPPSSGTINRMNNIYRGARNFAGNAAKAGRLGGQVARSGLQAGAKLAPLLANPVTWAVVGVAILFLIVFVIVLSGATTGEASPENNTFIGGGCPTAEIISANRDPSSCRYLNPSINIFDTSISPEAVNTYIEKYSGIFIRAGIGDKNEFIRRVNYIVDDAKQGKLNPAIFLGYWKTESNFSTQGNRHMGCAGDTFEEEVDCALAIKAFSDPRKNPIANCARSQDANSEACSALKNIRKILDQTHPIQYPVSTFDDFAESYGPYDHLTEGQPLNCISTYNKLIEVAQEMNACKAIPNGTIAPPANTDPKLLDLDILNTFGIAMDTKFDYSYLKWAWEKLWNISNTKFLSLIRGANNHPIAVLRNDNLINAQIGCNVISMRGVSHATGQPYPESLFKVVFIHELSHIIEQENCNPASIKRKDELSQIITQEGYLTSYSENGNVCVGGINNLNEDFAETIAYYLNDYPEQSLRIGQACEPKDARNPYQRNKPLHLKFAEELLGSINPRVSSTSLAKISCPVVGGGRNRLASFQADPVNGHCGTLYNQKLSNPVDQCSGNTRRGKSVDIETGGPTGKDVELPTIDGKFVDWQYIRPIPLTPADCFEDEILDTSGTGGGCGIGYVFKTPPAPDGGKNWVLHLLHMQEATNLTPNTNYPSGTKIGKSQAIHVHISIGQNIQNVVSQDEAGWKSVDKDLNVCSSYTP